MRKPSRPGTKGLLQFADVEQQAAWLEGEVADLIDAEERELSIEHRLKYAPRFQKLVRRPQALDVFEILELYGQSCLPMPRTTERYYWSVSCLPSTSDKPLVRVSASWMELFTLYADGDDLRSRFIVHMSDFTSDGSLLPERLDMSFLEDCQGVATAWSPSSSGGSDILVVRIKGCSSIRRFIDDPRTLRAVRRFNLTHMNRGRNAYQASHCYSVADYMLGDGEPA